MKKIIFIFIILSLLTLNGCYSVPSQNTKYIIEVYANLGLEFQGSIGAGRNSRSVQGIGKGPNQPIIYEVQGWPVSAVIQNHDDWGAVCINIKNSKGKTLASQCTEAAYGVVSLGV